MKKRKKVHQSIFQIRRDQISPPPVIVVLLPAHPASSTAATDGDTAARQTQDTKRRVIELLSFVLLGWTLFPPPTRKDRVSNLTESSLFSCPAAAAVSGCPFRPYERGIRFNNRRPTLFYRSRQSAKCSKELFLYLSIFFAVQWLLFPWRWQYDATGRRKRKCLSFFEQTDGVDLTVMDSCWCIAVSSSSSRPTYSTSSTHTKNEVESKEMAVEK